MSKEMATLGAGCFWCIESALKELHGVFSVVSGFSGGSTENPDYQSVCSGKTGHAEVVQIRFDNELISYATLLCVFFSLHDPTQLNRQGNDIGSQYRSVIFYHSNAQKKTAKALINQLERERVFDKPIVTQIEPEMPFHCAESQHQNYLVNNPTNSYCVKVISPKLEKFKNKYQQLLKKQL